MTASAAWLLINTRNATALRRLHPLMAAAVAQMPWSDATIPVCDATRWRAAFPSARGAHYMPERCFAADTSSGAA